jgi:hypothetical protein
MSFQKLSSTLSKVAQTQIPLYGSQLLSFTERKLSDTPARYIFVVCTAELPHDLPHLVEFGERFLYRRIF